MTSAADVDQAIFSAVLELSQRKKPLLHEVLDSHALISDLSLGSLDLAELIATLEFELKMDPFSAKIAIADVRTVGDLKSAYRSCL